MAWLSASCCAYHLRSIRGRWKVHVEDCRLHSLTAELLCGAAHQLGRAPPTPDWPWPRDHARYAGPLKDAAT